MELAVEYNSQRPLLIIPEYGRNVQKMIDYICSVKDKDHRNKLAKEVITLMGQMNPHLRDVEDFTHKLWDHLFIISGYKLDVDSPYPRPTPEERNKKPKKLPYPPGNIRYKHYGKIIEQLIDRAVKMEDGEEKRVLSEIIASVMKKNFLSWNRDSVNDKVIFDQLNELSGKKLKLREDFTLPETSEILSKVAKKKKKIPHKSGSGGDRPRKKY